MLKSKFEENNDSRVRTTHCHHCDQGRGDSARLELAAASADLVTKSAENAAVPHERADFAAAAAAPQTNWAAVQEKLATKQLSGAYTYYRLKIGS